MVTMGGLGPRFFAGRSSRQAWHRLAGYFMLEPSQQEVSRECSDLWPRMGGSSFQ